MTTWTTPRTWITGEVLSSSNFNTHIRDNMIHYGGADAINTTPPATPGNGQRWVYPHDAANGIYWELIYITALSAWVCTSGVPAFQETVASVTVTSASYTGYTGDPSITLARAGAYVVRWGAAVWTGSVADVYLAVRRGAAASVDADALTHGNYTGTAQGTPGTSLSRETLMTGLTAATVLKHEAKVTVGNTAGLHRRWLSVLPRYVT